MTDDGQVMPPSDFWLSKPEPRRFDWRLFWAVASIFAVSLACALLVSFAMGFQ